MLLTLGNATGIAYLTYHVPILNLFRAPARHFVEMAFAVSVLSGMGTAVVTRGMATRELALRTTAIIASLMLICLMALLWLQNFLSGLAIKKGITHLSLLPWTNPAVGVPLVVLLLAGSILIYRHRQPNSFYRSALLPLVLMLDLASFGWFYEWHYYAPHKNTLIPPSFAQRYRNELNFYNQRILPTRGGFGSSNEFPPLLSRLWSVPSASGYGPLIPSRNSKLLALLPHGAVITPWRNATDQSMNLMAIRYVFVPRSEAGNATMELYETVWFTEDMNISLGVGCGEPHPDFVKIDVPSPLSVTTIGIVSVLACSTQIPDNTEVLRVLLTDVNGHVLIQSLRVGRDTSEWAYDCSDVRPQMKHRRAAIFKSFPVTRNPESCEGHEYLTKLSLGGVTNVKTIELQWMSASGAISIKRMSLINEVAGRSIRSSLLRVR